MSTPVTRGELREDIQHLDLRLDHLDQKFEQRLAQLEAKIATKADLDRLDQKFEQRLAQMASEMATKADLAQLATQMATNLDLWGGALFERLLTELARHTKAIQEALSTLISTFDDKYADLPAPSRW